MSNKSAVYLFTITSLFLVGCAPMPKLEDRSDLAKIEVNSSFRAPETVWPDSDWWIKYNDPQLNNLIAIGLEGSPDIKIAESRFKQSSAFSESVESILYPNVNANGQINSQSFSDNYLFPAQMLPGGWLSSGQATINLNWEIDFWGKNRAAVASAVSKAQASKAEKEQAKLMISSLIAQNYADLSRAYLEQDTIIKSLNIREKTLNLFNQRQLHGMETKGAVDQVYAKMVLAKNDLVQNKTQIKLIKNKIATLVGKGPDFSESIKRPAVKFDYHYALPKEIDSLLLSRRPDIIAARWEVESKDSLIYQRKAEFFPNVNLAGLIGYQSIGLNNLIMPTSTFGNYGPTLYLPIFEGGKLRANLRQANASYEESVANYEKTLLNALQEVSDIAHNMSSLDEQINLSEISVKKATSSLSISKQRYEAGLTNYLEVLVAEDELLNMLRIQTGINARSFIYDVALNKSLGGGYSFSELKEIKEDKKIEEFPSYDEK